VSQIFMANLRVLLTSAIETLVKDTKKNFYIDNNIFYTLQTLTTQLSI
jgi:hypothetical protein